MEDVIDELKERNELVRKVLSPSISLAQYEALEGLYASMNARFFGGSLPDIVFLLDYGKHNVMGYFQFERVKSAGDGSMRSVISMNPDAFGRSSSDVAATLLHEMCHCWEAYVARIKPRSGYHDRHWAEEMRKCGLEPVFNNPSRTSCTHRIIEGGAFDAWWTSMDKDSRDSIILLEGAFSLDRVMKRSGDRNKTVYACPGCGARMWGKPALRVICVTCGKEFQEVKK